MGKNNNVPRILVFDIETAPILAHVWKLWDQNVGLNQIEVDWHVLSWSAKWLYSPAKEVMYQDQRKVKDITNDKKLLKSIWKLLDEADIVITQNGNSFDIKKLNARFLTHGFQPPSGYENIDTLRIAKSKFGFTSNKLEYMTDTFCTKYKKLKHNKFPGFDLWKECLSGNLRAWKEMEKYNKHDVLSLEELYLILQPWWGGINFDIYRDDEEAQCNCGSMGIIKNGIKYTKSARYQRYKCKDCGAEFRGRVNLLHLKDRPLLRT